MYTHREELSKRLRNVPIADTPDGTNWAIKALHPADHEAVPRGMPTRDATSVVNMQFQREFLIVPPDGLTPGMTWDADIWLLRDPLTMASVMTSGTDGSAPAVIACENRQLGATHREGVIALQELCEAYRVSYESATIHLIAPATANQGTVRAAQYDFPAYLRPFIPSQNETAVMSTDCVTYPDKLLTYGTLIQMPNAYQAEAREGVYMPLKLTERDMGWTVTNQVRILYGQDLFGQDDPTYTAEPGRRWPWYDTTEGLVFGYKPGDVIGHMCFRGLSDQATLNMVVRCGVDMKVRPETMYSPFNHEPPVYDSLAIKMYFEIARRMSDAYPAKYNSTGALMQVVASIAQSLWPLVEPKAKELLERLTAKINQKVQQIGRGIKNAADGSKNALPAAPGRGKGKGGAPNGTNGEKK